MTDTAHLVPESDTALIRVEDVSYRYGAFMALTSVSLRVGAACGTRTGQTAVLR